MTLLELTDPSVQRKARAAITKIAGELQIASGELMGRFAKRLARFNGNGTRAISQLELDMNLSRGRLKGFDVLYNQSTQGV